MEQKKLVRGIMISSYVLGSLVSLSFMMSKITANGMISVRNLAISLLIMMLFIPENIPLIVALIMNKKKKQECL